MEESYSVNESMVAPCLQRGMAIQIYLAPSISYTFQKNSYENNVTTHKTNGYVKKHHSPLQYGVYCCEETGTDYSLVNKSFALESFHAHIVRQAIDIKVLPYIKTYKDESPEAANSRMFNVKRIIERMWKKRKI